MLFLHCLLTPVDFHSDVKTLPTYCPVISAVIPFLILVLLGFWNLSIVCHSKLITTLWILDVSIVR